MARLWDRRGIEVFEEGGVYWTRYRGPIYATFPNNIGLAPEPGEMAALLRKARIFGARVPSNGRGLSCALHVANPSEYCLEGLSRRHRGHVRHGLERCEIKPVDLDELLLEGIVLNRETLERQQRQDPEFTDVDRWARFVRSVRETSGCFVTGAYVDGRLAAYLVMCRDGAWLRLLYKMSRTADMVHDTNYALDYKAIEEASKDPSILAVENGFSSLNCDTGVDAYKKRLGYVAVPTQLSIYLHPAIAPFAANRPMIAAVRAVGTVRPRKASALAAKVLEGAIETRKYEASRREEAEPVECQQSDSRAFARYLRSYPALLAWRLAKSVRKRGIGAALRGPLGLIAASLRSKQGPDVAVPGARARETLGLRPGEWVEVKSEAEILATLDANRKCRGLSFTEDMRSCLGKRYPVLKRVERIYLEEARQNRSLKNTVILEGAHCSGAGFDCDRYCYHFWREAWLRRVDGPAPNGRSHVGSRNLTATVLTRYSGSALSVR